MANKYHIIKVSAFLVEITLFFSLVLPAYAEKPSYKGQNISVVTFGLAGINEIKERIAEFEARYGIKVNYRVMQMGAAREKMMIDFTSGAANVDVGMSSIHITPDHLKRNNLEPVDRFIESELAEPELLALDDFSETALNNVTFPEEVLKGEKKMWGLPHDLLVQGVIYRKSLYKKYGLKAPDTLEELIVNAKKITAQEAPKTYGIGFRAKRGPQILWAWTQIFRAMGGKFFQNYPTDLTPTLNNETTIEAIRFFVDSFDFAPPGAKSWAYTELISALQNGTVAQTMDDFMFSRFIEDPEESAFPEDWGYSLIPLKKGLTYENVKFGPSVAMSNHWVINKDISEARKQASWKFIQWATSKPLLDELIRTGAMKGVLTRKSMYEYVKDKKWAKVHMATQKHASKFFRPKLPEWAELSDALATQISRAVIGDISPEKAAEIAQQEFEQILKRAGYSI